MNSLISVIVPIYNVEAYLENCLDSIRVQTYSNIEILLVNDGSTDDCGAICDRYARMDKRIHVIQIKNSGVSAARNEGLYRMQGEYVCFVDADDIVSPYYVEVLYNGLNGTDADISIAADSTKYNLITCFDRNDIEKWSRQDILVQYIDHHRFNPRVACKLFTKKSVKNLIFDTRYRIAEDKLFLFTAILQSQKFTFQEKAVYYYFQRNDSAMHNNLDKQLGDSKAVADILYDKCCKLLPELAEMFYKEKVMSYARDVQASVMYDSEYAKTARGNLLPELKRCKISGVWSHCTKKEIMLLIVIKYCIPLLRLFEKYKQK